MEKKDFKNSSIPQSYSTGLYSEMNYNVAKDHAWKVLDMMVNGVTEILRDIKSKQQPVAFTFTRGEDFVLGAYVQFFENEDDPSNPGNWTYAWTFNKEDIPENARVVTAYDPMFSVYFRNYGQTKFEFYPKTIESQGDTFGYMAHTIRKWLDENAAENDKVVLELEGVVEFAVAVEDGEKVFACELDGEVKQRVKGTGDSELAA